MYIGESCGAACRELHNTATKVPKCWAIVLGLWSLALVACQQGAPTLTPVPTATPTATSEPSPTPTRAPVPTLAPTPTRLLETLRLTPTLFPTATPTSTPKGTPTPLPTPTAIQEPTPFRTPFQAATPRPSPTPTLLHSPSPTATLTPPPRASPVKEFIEVYDPKWLGEYMPVAKGEAANYDYADPEALALPSIYRLYVEEKGKHQIVSFLSNDGINWTREEGARVPSGAFPDAVPLPDGRVRVYFQGFKTILSAISNDGGLTFVQEAGVRVPTGWHGEFDPDNVAAPSVVRLPNGRYRMYYIGRKIDPLYANSAKQVILSAISEDGLSFAPENGVRIKPEDWLGPTLPKFGPMGELTWSYIDGPEAVLAEDGNVKLYFWGGCEGICLSKSKDGLTFEAVGEVFSNTQLPVKGNAGDPAILQLKDGTSLLFYNSVLNNRASIYIAKQSTTVASTSTPVPTPLRSPPATPQVEPSFEVTVDPGIRLNDAGIPFVLKLREGKFRMYYCGPGGILSTISSDGLAFTKESGTRLSSIGPPGNAESVVCDPSVVELPNGKFRMYYKGGTSGGGPGQSIQKIFSAISSDGLTFQREGLVIDSAEQDNGFASVPEAIRLSDGRVRIYFVSDGSYVGHGTVSAISSDGITFTREATKVTAFVDPAITTLPDGRFVLIAPAIPLLPKGIKPSVSAGIYALVSQDGINFGSPKTVLSDGKIWIDPTVVRISSDTYRVYYWNPNEQPAQIHSLTVRLK